MGIFDSSSESTSLTAGSEQGSQAQDDGTASNINITAGDDQNANVNISEDNSVYQVDESDNSVDNSIWITDQSVRTTTNTDNSDSSVTQIDSSDNSDYSVTTIDNSVDQTDSSTTSTTNTDNSSFSYTDNTQTYVTTTDFGAIEAAASISKSSIEALTAQTTGLFATVDDILEGYGAQTDETIQALSGSFATSVEQIADENTTAQESLITNTYYLIGAMVGIAGLAYVFGR